MNETVTGSFFLVGIVTMLLALYHTKSDRSRSKKFIIIAMVAYVIATISIFTDNEDEALIAHFNSGESLMCRDITVSQKEGWSVKGDDYLVKDKQIFYVKMCRKL